MEKANLPSRKPDAILFDMDETILDHGDLLRKSFKAAFANVTPKQYRSLGARLSELGQTNHHAHVRWQLLQDWAYEKHPPLRPLLSTLSKEFDEAATIDATTTLYPGVKNFLIAAAAQGIDRHLVTRARPDWLRQNVEAHGLAEYFTSIRSIRETPVLMEKQDAYKEIVTNHVNRLGRPPHIWIVGDNVGDYPDSHFAQTSLKGSDISLIAVTSTCQAYDFLSHSEREPYVIGTYDGAADLLNHLTP